MKAVSTAASTLRHTFGVALEALLILAIAGALVFGAALATGLRPAGADSVFAARGGNGNGGGNGGASAIWIDQSSLRSTDATLHFQDSLGFGYTSDSATSIQLQCFQPVGSDALVFSDFRMLFEGGVGYGEPFTLGPSLAWTGGEASCTGILGHRSNSGRYMVEATVDFPVAP